MKAVISHPVRRSHKWIPLLVLLLFPAISLVTIAAPTIFFAPGTELMPGCAPGTCTVRIGTASSSQAGLLSAADWSLFNGKQDALGYTPYNAANPNGYITFSKIASSSDVVLNAPVSGNFLRYNGANWLNANLAPADIPDLDMSKVTTGTLHWARVTSTPTTLSGYGIADSIVNTFNGRSGAVTLSTLDVTSTLGYLPYNASNPEGYISFSTIASSSDVSLSVLTAGNFLKHDGVRWTNSSLAAADIPGLDMSKIATGNLNWSRITSTPTTAAGYGITDSLVNSFNGRSGAVVLAPGDVTTTLGYIPYDAANPANYVTLRAFSAVAPLSYSSSTGVFSLPQASSTADGYLSAQDWSTFNNKLAAVLHAGKIFIGNGLDVASEADVSGDAMLSSAGVLTIVTGTITSAKILDGALLNADLANPYFATLVGTVGTDVNFSAPSTTLGGVMTLNLPNAGAAARGLVTTGTQAFAGDKAFLTTTTFMGALFSKTGTPADDVLVISPKVGGGLSFTGNLTFEDLTANRTWTLPNASGTLMLTSGSLPLNQTAAATAAAEIDSLNFTQAWNWSTAAAQSPFTLAAAALTTGNLLSLHSTSTLHTGNALLVNDASIGTFTNGGVRFNFSGAHGGNGVQVNDATTIGNAVAIVANSLTSGSGLSLTSSSTGLTGDLAKIEATGSNAGINGNVLKIGLVGPLATGTALNVTNAGTGLAFRVNDDGTYADPSPFVVDANGNVGVGTTSPSYALHIIASTAGTPVMGLQNSSPTGYPGIEYADANGTVNLYVGYDNTNGQSRINSVNNKPIRMLTNSTDALFIGNNQRIGVGTTTPASALHVIGKVTASAGFSGQCVSALTFALAGGNSCNQDIAESYATFELTEPGDIVALPPPDNQETDAASAMVKIGKSRGVSGETALGVVSTNPGLVFRDGLTYLAGANDQLVTTTSTVVALAGRVPVKVSLQNGPIRAGDELAVSADLPGTAVRAVRPGFVIGVALEAYSTESSIPGVTPRILIFVGPHWSLGNLVKNDDIASGPDGTDQFGLYVRHALRAFGLAVADGVATVRELVTGKVTTHELCLDDLCVNKEQLQHLIQKGQGPTTGILSAPTTEAIEDEADKQSPSLAVPENATEQAEREDNETNQH